MRKLISLAAGLALSLTMMTGTAPASALTPALPAAPVTAHSAALSELARLEAQVRHKPKHSREWRAAHSKAARDLTGGEPSLYRGKYFRKSQEAFRLCVGDREASFGYTAKGGAGGNYYGTYQISYKFQRGVSGKWGTPGNMATESKHTKDGLRKQAWKLLDKPIHRWSRYWQDRAFFTILNFEGDWKGREHWGNGAWHC